MKSIIKIITEEIQKFTALTEDGDVVADIINAEYNKDNVVLEAKNLNDNFWKWFGQSKIVNKAGKPLIMHHGGSFSPTKSTKPGIVHPLNDFRGVGWFTSSKADAKHYAKQSGGNNLTSVYLKIENPLYAGKQKDGTYIEANTAVLLAQKSNGKYDGVIDVDDNGDILDAIVWNSRQIKSIDNNGEYSQNNPDVTKEEVDKINKKLYYHGRKMGGRPYSGSYIFITDNLGYASGYSDGKELYTYTIPFSDEKLFSIRNPKHRLLLSKFVDDQSILHMRSDSGPDQELDWAALSYVNSDEFDQPEDLLEHLGFLGIRLKERTGIESIYIFDQKNLKFMGIVDITTPEMIKSIGKFYKDFSKDKNFLENIIKEEIINNEEMINEEETIINEELNKISLQTAVDKKMFGPVYHGTTTENREKIEREGFKIFMGAEAGENIRHGYPGEQEYAHGTPPPIHHLGYGIYFTTVKAIAKAFNVDSAKGLKTYYLDVPRLETINFASPKRMMDWWIKNGYDPELAKTGQQGRIDATKRMTEALMKNYDAVWFKGKTMYRVLDGDQIVVFDTQKIYQIDPELAGELEIGSKIRRTTDKFDYQYTYNTDSSEPIRTLKTTPSVLKGTIGIIVDKKSTKDILQRWKNRVPPPDNDAIANAWFKDSDYVYTIKWNKGGTENNVLDKDLEPLNKQKMVAEIINEEIAEIVGKEISEFSEEVSEFNKTKFYDVPQELFQKLKLRKFSDEANKSHMKIFKAKDGKEYLIKKVINEDIFHVYGLDNLQLPIATAVFDVHIDYFTGYEHNQSIQVKPEYRRLGLATALTDFAEKLYNLSYKPTNLQTPEMQGFVKNRFGNK
jgi:hypothetical protein